MTMGSNRLIVRHYFILVCNAVLSSESQRVCLHTSPLGYIMNDSVVSIISYFRSLCWRFQNSRKRLYSIKKFVSIYLSNR